MHRQSLIVSQFAEAYTRIHNQTFQSISYLKDNS